MATIGYGSGSFTTLNVSSTATTVGINADGYLSATKGASIGGGITATGGMLYQATTVSKTTNYIVTVADSGTVFDNTGAGATVVTFTLPTAAVGLIYTFCDILTVALSGIVVAPQSGDTIAYTTKTAGQSVSSPLAARGAIVITCTAVNTWAVTSIIGTWT